MVKKTSKTKRKFAFSPKKLKVYTEEFKRLEQKYSGMISTKDIVREASNSKSPIHDWFDWDDSSAGEKYRLHQARMLMQTIKVKAEFEGGEKSYKKYLNVQIPSSDGKGFKNYYVNTKIVLNNESMREQILRKAIQEVEYWKRSYIEYQELEDIFKGVQKTKKKLKKILVTQ